MTDSERWAVKDLAQDALSDVTAAEPRRFYVQDTRLGYCSEVTTESAARTEARRRNRDEP